jgi:hypothetical protein
LNEQLKAANHKVYVVGGNYAIEKMFHDEGVEPVPNVSAATMVCFTGGADVDPRLYGEPRHPTTSPNPQRDVWETRVYRKALAEVKLLVGICRGGQFLNVMNGGSMWQDVDNHAMRGEHPLIYKTPLNDEHDLERIVMVTSTHHQMMIPNVVGTGAQIWAMAGLATRKVSGRKSSAGGFITLRPMPNHRTDCEIVYYPKTRSVCFQPHPEYQSQSTKDLFFTCIERALAA